MYSAHSDCYCFLFIHKPTLMILISVLICVVEHVKADALSDLNHRLLGVTSVNHGRL